MIACPSTGSRSSSKVSDATAADENGFWYLDCASPDVSYYLRMIESFATMDLYPSIKDIICATGKAICDSDYAWAD